MQKIEKGATYLDRLCHRLYDEPKGRGFQVDGKCRCCGGPLMTYYCEDRLYLITCEKCGTLALTKSVAPQVAANLTLRNPILTPLNEPLTLEQLREMDGRPVWVVYDQDAAKTTPGFDPLALWALVEVTKDSVFLTNNLGGRTAYADDQDLEWAGITVYHRPTEVEK